MFMGNVNAQENTSTSQEVKLDANKNKSTSDSGVYLKFNVGYNFSMGSQSFGSNRSSKGNERSYEAVYGSFGKGFNIDGAIGFKFNEHVGMELGLSYLMGGKIESKDYSEYGSYEYTSSYSFKANMLRINPSIIIEAGKEGINPYAKLGFIIGIGSVTIERNSSEYDGSTTDTYARTEKFNGGVSFGANAALGAYYPISDKISLFGEMTFVSMAYAPKKGEFTSSTENGRDVLGNMTTRERETNFVKEYSRDTNDNPKDSEPSTELIYKMPFGSLGFNFGVKIGL